jgi:hypothetical protein
MSADRILRVRIAGKAPAVRALLREVQLDVACAGARRRSGDEMSLEAFATEAQLERVRHAGLTVDVIEDASAVAHERQQEVGKGNRFAGRVLPRGVGKKVKAPQ